MHIRPRCREWLPLASQQLRLRNLVRIQGLNIECMCSNSLVYYTLHSTSQGAEFYKSEALPARQQQLKWAEIACSEMLKSNLNCVCVKIWEQLAADDDSCSFTNANSNHRTHLNDKNRIDEDESALSKKLLNSFLPLSSQPRPPDKLLFMWGVYFSGLIPINLQMEPKYLPNSLIFQLNGDYFASPEYFTLDSLRDQLSLSYKRFSTSAPKDGNPIADEFSINSPKVSRSSSPVSFSPNSKDSVNSDLLSMSKARYVELSCCRSEVRNSYNLQKLLEMQDLQRLCLQKSKEALDITSEIKEQSVRCITTEQLTRKKRTSSTSASTLQHHSMGRALSLLLSKQQQRDPKTLLHSQKLQEQIESHRFRQRLLQSEYDTYSTRIVQLRKRLAAHIESRQQLQGSLQKRQQQLKHDKAQMEQRYQEMVAELQSKRHVVQNVERRMSSLCMELREIYPISRNQQGLYTICGIPFPNMEVYLNDGRYVSAQDASITPMALSASLGYVAHLVQMISVIINRPLRNPIHHEGSRTRILDIVKDIPYGSREFPLYSRSTIPSNPVKYAIYLLNQNIAQLCYDITGIRGDLRATIDNILHIFATLAEIEQNQSRETHLSSRTHPNNRLTLQSGAQQHNMDCLSKSHSSVDLNNVPVPKMSTMVLLPSSIPIQIAERGPPQQRICRSVGSYSDCEDDFKDIMDHCYSNSDSNITNQSFAK